MVIPNKKLIFGPNVKNSLILISIPNIVKRWPNEKRTFIKSEDHKDSFKDSKIFIIPSY